MTLLELKIGLSREINLNLDFRSEKPEMHNYSVTN